MTSKLERAALNLAVKLRSQRADSEGQTCYQHELAALEAALQTAPIEREAIEDLPRMIELERHEPKDATGAWDDWESGWNSALETAAAIVRFTLTKAEERN